MKISFEPMTDKHIPLFQKWIQKDHVKNVWFIEGYEPADYIHQKIIGNGYDYPFIIYLDDHPVGYITCCNLFAYRTLSPKPKGLFTHEPPHTYCMDLFIGEENHLHKGYGTEIVKSFIKIIFDQFQAQTIFIDPAITNKIAIHCYEKAGFKFVKEAFDGVTNCAVMKIEKIKNIQLIPAQPKDLFVVKNMMQFYIYDMSTYLGRIKGWEMNENGQYDGIETLPLYWQEKDRYPFIVRVDNELAGFALINKIGSSPDIDWNMGEFFITHRFQKQGIGRNIAFQCFDQFQGSWEVMVIPGNDGAYPFWKIIIDQYTHGNFQETMQRLIMKKNEMRHIFKFESKSKSA